MRGVRSAAVGGTLRTERMSAWGIGVHRPLEEAIGARLLDHFAEVQDEHRVGEQLHHTEVV